MHFQDNTTKSSKESEKKRKVFIKTLIQNKVNIHKAGRDYKNWGCSYT